MHAIRSYGPKCEIFNGVISLRKKISIYVLLPSLCCRCRYRRMIVRPSSEKNRPSFSFETICQNDTNLNLNGPLESAFEIVGGNALPLLLKREMGIKLQFHAYIFKKRIQLNT